LPLKDLIQLAYGVRDFQVTGGPAWTGSDWFAIRAKATGPATNEQMMRMLATLLADRFQLTFHRETKAVPVYALRVSKNGARFGPKFHPANPSDPKPTGGTFRWRANMAQFAGYISLYLKYPLPNSDGTVNERVGLPIVDETNLTGDYDIVVDLQPGYDWFAMLPDQLGLNLEARKEPVEVIVIDTAARPIS
jgi:uncharacterized protein (TIGR03435 family)